MAKLWGREYSRAELLRRVGDISQVASAQPVELVDGNQRGCRCVNLRNAAGLDFSVVTERGMAITDLRFQGVPLAFLTPVGSVHPAYGGDLRGLDFLRTWPGGFLTPCGLTQVGSPVRDGGEELGLHGWLAGIPARNVAWGGEWRDDDYQVGVRGVVRETAMFGWNVELTRRIWTGLSDASFWVEDRVENLGYTPAPLMILQHINLGFPLVDVTTRLELPSHTTLPRTEVARGGLEQCLEFQEPTHGYSEQVFYHTLEPDAQGQVDVRLVNPAFDGGRGLGVSLRYAVADYPVLTEWKQMGEGLYAVGVEPGNCRVEGRVVERERGTLQTLQPGEARSFRLQVSFFRP
jgi:hypothetical protein